MRVMFRKAFLFIIVIFLFFITFALWQFFYGIRNIDLVGAVIQFESSVDNDICRQVNSIKDASGIFVKFQYKDRYKYPLGILNNFVYRERFNKIKLKAIHIQLVDIDGVKVDITPFLKNFVDKTILTKYISQEIIVPSITQRTGVDANGSNIHDDFIQLFESKIEKSKFIYEIYDSLKSAKLSHGLNSLEGVKMYKLIDEYGFYSFNNIYGLYCPNNLPLNNYTEDSFVGNVPFFIELYNKDYIQNGADDIYPGFLMKINFPSNIELNNMSSIDIEIELDGYNNILVNRTEF